MYELQTEKWERIEEEEEDDDGDEARASDVELLQSASLSL